jgi:tRNA (guanine-N7-)-methyltransferase
VQTWVLDELARVLKDGAEFRVASDIPGYVAWTLERVMPHPAFEWTAEGPSDWKNRPGDWPQTRYEAKAIRAGRRPAYLKFRRIPRV